MSEASSQLIPAYIQAARIVDVDPVRFTCTLRTEVGDQDARNVPIPSVYTHPFEGEGIHHMPEIGAHVWAVWTSEGDTRARIMNYRGLSNEGSSHRANRPGMVPGDMMMVSRDRNGVKIRRGGVVEIISTPLARTFYLPINNEVLTYAENWNVETLGGSIRWNTARKEEDPDLQKGAKLTFSVKEFVDHPNPAITFQMGGQIDPENEENDQILDLRLWQDSTVDTFLTPLSPSVSLVANRSGEVSLATYLPSAGLPGVPAAPSVDVSLNQAAEMKVALAPGLGGQHAVFEDEANTEGVLLSVTFLTQLQKSLTEISAGLNGVGILTPETATLLGAITASLLPDKGGAPYVSTRSRTE